MLRRGFGHLLLALFARIFAAARLLDSQRAETTAAALKTLIAQQDTCCETDDRKRDNKESSKENLHSCNLLLLVLRRQLFKSWGLSENKTIVSFDDEVGREFLPLGNHGPSLIA